MDIKQEYNNILSEIAKLQAKKEQLEAKMIEESNNFADKFRIWYNNDDICHNRYILDEEKYPILRKLFNENIDENRRGKTYELYDLLENGEDDFYFFLDGEMDKEEESLYLEKYQSAFEEAMKNKMKTFCADW
jgi:hypothetical protein